MEQRDVPPSLLSGRGVLLIEDFCRHTGLARPVVEELARDARLDGVLWTSTEPSHPVGIFDDALPSREALTALGLQVDAGYDPEAFRSYEMTDAGVEEGD